MTEGQTGTVEALVAGVEGIVERTVEGELSEEAAVTGAVCRSRDMRDTRGMPSENLLAGPPPTLLPDEPGPREALASGTAPAEVAAQYPAASLPWALLAEQALDSGQTVAGYAYARVGYHRGLDALRRNGWKGHGPVPWEHEPNRGFLRSLHALGRAATGIGETAEIQRIEEFLRDSDPATLDALGPLDRPSTAS